MSYIENNFDLRGFISGVPKELIEDTKNYISKFEGTDDIIEFIILFGNNAEITKKSCEDIGASFEDLGFGFGIISINSDDFEKLSQIRGVQYIEFPKVFTTNDIESNTSSCIPPVWNNYGLTGKGTLIGFIDTGIDYTHPAFIDENGKSRIKYIYDLFNGDIYNENQINEALLNLKPESIVPANDYIGHGTAVVSVAAGGGKIEKSNYGVAFEASIIMVKITGDDVLKSTLSTQVMRGLKFLIDKSNELLMPLTVNISLSSNDGAHNGSSLIEKYIFEYAQIQRVAVVVAAGNEGSAGHHYSTKLKDKKDVFLNIGNRERNINIQVYRKILLDINFQIISPTGNRTGILIGEKGIQREDIGSQKLTIYNSGPKPFDKTGEISINIRSKEKDEFIESGQWVIRIINTSGYKDTIDMWLPISAALGKDTKFLSPDPFNTLGIPATVSSVISVGSYNFSADNYSYFSGRGVRRVEHEVKPDILAPGENINAAISDGGFGPETGTSVASPQVAGACSLILEWGIVQNNDSYLFGEKLKYYLIKGARRRRKTTIYPSRTYGYGYLCLSDTMSILVPYDKENKEKVKSIAKPIKKVEIKKNENLINENKVEKLNKEIKFDEIASLKINLDKENIESENGREVEIVDIKIDSKEGEVLGKKKKKYEKNKDKEEFKEDNDVKKEAEKENKKEKKEFKKEKKFEDKKENKKKDEIKIHCSKLKESTSKLYYLDDGYIDFLVQYEGNIIRAIEEINDIASAFTLDESYAIISALESKINKVTSIKEIVYIDSGGVYTLEATSPSEASQALPFHYNPYLNLTGEGTIVGIVDSGIDFFNKDFIKADGTSNIMRIWDQSIQEDEENDNILFGVEYTNEDINNALEKGREKGSKLVKSIDNNGHGTAVAGIIAGRGNNESVTGIAKNAEIVMVKLKVAGEKFKKLYASEGRTEYQYRNTDILLGIRYLFNLSKETNKPIVIYIPLGTTVGGHDGSCVIERYIDDLSDSSGVLFVNSTGNEGTGDNHTSGRIEKKGDRHNIELEVGENQTSIFMIIYAKAPDRMGLSIVSPSGDSIDNISPKQKHGVDINFVYEGTTMNVMFVEPSELTGDEVIIVRAENLKPGVWTFILIGEYIVHGTYNSWLLQRELLDENTKFLTPTPDMSVTIPATSYSIISVASYNQNNNATVSSSGRGLTRDGRQCPLISAGGIDAIVTAPNDEKRMVSGGSVASAVIAGCCLQLLEWGIVKKNDRAIYATKVQTYLMRGTNQRSGYEYPNSQVGYGTIDMKTLFENMRGSALGSPKEFSDAKFTTRGKADKSEDFGYKGLYFRLPSKE